MIHAFGDGVSESGLNEHSRKARGVGRGENGFARCEVAQKTYMSIDFRHGRKHGGYLNRTAYPGQPRQGRIHVFGTNPVLPLQSSSRPWEDGLQNGLLLSIAIRKGPRRLGGGDAGLANGFIKRRRRRSGPGCKGARAQARMLRDGVCVRDCSSRRSFRTDGTRSVRTDGAWGRFPYTHRRECMLCPRLSPCVPLRPG